MSLLFKNYSLVEVIYLLIRLLIKTKSFLRNTKNTDTNGVIEQNIYREKDNFRKGYLVLVIPSIFRATLPLFYQLLLLWENFLNF